MENLHRVVGADQVSDGTGGFQVGAAVMQVARAGSEEQVAKTREILDETRRRIYGLLVGEEDGSD